MDEIVEMFKDVKALPYSNIKRIFEYLEKYHKQISFHFLFLETKIMMLNHKKTNEKNDKTTPFKVRNLNVFKKRFTCEFLQ